MTTLWAAVVLGFVHASIVALATLIVQCCVTRRLAAERALAGAMGMACVLGVTALAALPLPGIFRNARAEADKNSSAAVRAAKTRGSEPSGQGGLVSSASSQIQEKSAAESGMQVSQAWLLRLADGFRRIHAGTSAASSGWRLFGITLILMGSGIGLTRLAFALRSAQRLRGTSAPVVDAAVTTIVGELQKRCGCRRAIELRETPDLTSAATCGWLRPVIFLPQDWRQWSPAELAAVLAHEVAHVQRADFLHRLVALVGVGIHFYQPLVRAAAWRLAADQELAADQLARGLLDDPHGYARGLAQLALRYHDSFPDRRAWLSVSAMPRSSDFLARRLEMLRVKSGSTDNRVARIVSLGVGGGLVAVALATTLLRGAAAADDRPTESSPQPVKVARLPPEKAAVAAPVTSTTPESELFSREAFDPSMIRLGDKGAYLIRVGDFLRHPEVQPHVDELNKSLAAMLRPFIGEVADKNDLREVEWMAGNLIVAVGASKNPGAKRQFTFGSGEMIIRTKHAANWQEEILKGIPGSSLKSFEGKSYVELPFFLEIGLGPLLMRSPDDRTIIYQWGAKENEVDARAMTVFLRGFSDDTPKPRAWHSAWRAVDGGLVTLAFDNTGVSWRDLPDYQKDTPEFARTLAEKSQFFAAGCDWTEKSNRTGLRVRSTCAERSSVKELQLATMTALSNWPKLFLEGGDSTAKYHQRILQFFSSLDVQASAAGAEEENYVQATADVGWDPREFFEILRPASAWLFQN